MQRRNWYAAGLAIALVGKGAPAWAAPAPAPAFVPMGDQADAPHGFVALCARDAQACAGPRNASDAGPADAEQLLARVNSDVNRRVRQQADEELFGEQEHWQAAGSGPDAAGDCEDLALQKRDALIQAGFPAARLFLAVVYQHTAGLHTVLVARLDSGDRVLDSRDPRILPWHRTSYRWLRMQQPGAPGVWRRSALA
jgi:predicted transglutaminase-like cysteine proteinase